MIIYYLPYLVPFSIKASQQEMDVKKLVRLVKVIAQRSFKLRFKIKLLQFTSGTNEFGGFCHRAMKTG